MEKVPEVPAEEDVLKWSAFDFSNDKELQGNFWLVDGEKLTRPLSQRSYPRNLIQFEEISRIHRLICIHDHLEEKIKMFKEMKDKEIRGALEFCQHKEFDFFPLYLEKIEKKYEEITDKLRRALHNIKKTIGKELERIDEEHKKKLESQT